MKIHVTEEDIKNGVPETCGECPIALAVSRVFRGADVAVGLETISIGCTISYLPEEAAEFVERFDNDEPVKPFAFELAAVPDPETVTP